MPCWGGAPLSQRGEGPPLLFWNTAEDLAEALVDAGMLESPAPGRYRLHDLLRLYGRRHAESTERAEDRAAALRRVLALLYGSAVLVARTALPDDALSPAWLRPVGHPGIAFEAPNRPGPGSARSTPC
ncbi:hypothetical protein [Streptomyces sp. NPDC051286]|uniref:hypothetical protein n=1 Tax=Streptomyces sp. NPDC051286 TaxID=3365647 RepID=UPI003790FB67